MTPQDSKAGQTPRVLIVYFSFSAQTSGLLQHLGSGLSEEGVEVRMERLQPRQTLRFPLRSVFATLVMMGTTLFRKRIPVEELSPACWEEYDLVILAGPTWSYNPSGPVLAMLDRDGKRLFEGKTMVPLISCRGYWRLHWLGLRRLLEKCGAVVVNRIVFCHPVSEPWRTMGVFLKLAGKFPERGRIIGRYYTRYGHSRSQLEEAHVLGSKLARALKKETDLAEVDLTTSSL
jgi:hypothetical protein